MPDTSFRNSAKGVYKLEMKFPVTFPMEPPELKFSSEFWHPNGPAIVETHPLPFCTESNASRTVYKDGKVCISILHPPGEDAMSGERPEERWLPTHSVSSIMLSIVSMLNDPNISSPANMDASVCKSLFFLHFSSRTPFYSWNGGTKGQSICNDVPSLSNDH